MLIFRAFKNSFFFIHLHFHFGSSFNNFAVYVFISIFIYLSLTQMSQEMSTKYYVLNCVQFCSSVLISAQLSESISYREVEVIHPGTPSGRPAPHTCHHALAAFGHESGGCDGILEEICEMHSFIRAIHILSTLIDLNRVQAHKL